MPTLVTPASRGRKMNDPASTNSRIVLPRLLRFCGSDEDVCIYFQYSGSGWKAPGRAFEPVRRRNGNGDGCSRTQQRGQGRNLIIGDRDLYKVAALIVV